MKVAVTIFYIIGVIFGTFAIRHFLGVSPEGICVYVAWFCIFTTIYLAAMRP